MVSVTDTYILYIVSGPTLNFKKSQDLDEKSQDWTKIPKLYWKHEKTVKMRTVLHSQI